MLLSHFLLSILGLYTFTSAQNDTDLSWIPFDRNPFTNNTPLDTQGDVQLFWALGDEYSTFGIASRSNGYLALGFSETGGMTGADMAIGSKDNNGSFIFENRHATGFVTPQVSQDQVDNMRFKEGYQENGVTAFVFEKKNTAECAETQGDVHEEGWQWFIYAFSDQNIFAQHGEGHMGKQYIKLGTGTTVAINEARSVANTRNFTVSSPEVTIPSDETTYCYSLHKMPAGQKNFLVAERPPQASPLLHHLVLYACYDLPDEYKDLVGKDPDCNWEDYSNPCTGFVTEWAPGMSARTFEPGFGKPFGTDHYEYVMLETHYNNPEGLVGEKDAATYSFLWTDQQVDTEIGTLTLGDVQVSGWFLEPGKEIVAHSTVCTPECTDNWPSDGITAVSVFHHMHYRGRNARVQIIRDGKEITPLSSLRHFDYDYQFSKNINETQLLPGDKLITTCEYDTTNDTEPVPGGQPSSAEMCFAWVDYYPANDVLACTQRDNGYESDNDVNGTSGWCVLNSEDPRQLFKSDSIASPFEHLPVSGNNCTEDVVSTTSGQSGQAAVVKTCPAENVCFSLNVPQQSASSGSGDIYFQISAPTSYSWVALGQGTMMNNANMFVMYSSADGNNVTLSPRTAPGHEMPTHNAAADISLLPGSGISNGIMTANVRCGSCSSWSTGRMNLQSGSSDWVYAHLPGPPLDSDDRNAPISQHNGMGSFQWDLSQATGGASTNPFAAGGATTTNSSSTVSGARSQSNMIKAHGALASIAFIAAFPIGAMLVRLASFRGLVWIHASIQIFAYALFIAAAGLGISLANQNSYLQEPHAIIGLVLLGTLFLMPLLGTMHHQMYKKLQKRTLWAYSHISVGRGAILLGIINGGLGLRLAQASRSATVAYGVFAGLMGVIYVGAAVFGELRRGKQSSKNVVTFSSAGTEPKDPTREDSGSGSDGFR